MADSPDKMRMPLPGADLDAPATPTELKRFAELQARFAASFETLFSDPLLPRTVVIVPSLTVDPDVLVKVSGAHHYEERMLCLLLLLRMPRTHVVYVTSTRISDTIIDYYLHLLQGIPGLHARRRLTLIACNDASIKPLTRKILERPRMIARIRAAISDSEAAHLACFTVTELERKLALSLGIPIFGCDPALAHWGSKTGSRTIFREAGVAMPLGYENLSSADDLARALAELKTEKPDLERAVVKLNEGFSGEGNAICEFAGAPSGGALMPWLRDRLPKLAFEARTMNWDLYQEKFGEMGGVVEEFIPGAEKRSPSSQMRINPGSVVERLSTHDQVLGGPSGQIFTGCRFPADAAYRLDIQAQGHAVGRVLASKGVLGRFAVDFISVREDEAWRHYAIEINLRKGGTTHPFLMLEFLTDGRYVPETGEFVTPAGQPRCYVASDNLESERYRGLTPHDLVDIAVFNDLHFHAAAGEGVAFHLVGALSEFGKLGVVCIGATPARADDLYAQTMDVLERECGGSEPASDA